MEQIASLEQRHEAEMERRINIIKSETEGKVTDAVEKANLAGRWNSYFKVLKCIEAHN